MILLIIKNKKLLIAKNYYNNNIKAIKSIFICKIMMKISINNLKISISNFSKKVF